MDQQPHQKTPRVNKKVESTVDREVRVQKAETTDMKNKGWLIKPWKARRWTRSTEAIYKSAPERTEPPNMLIRNPQTVLMKPGMKINLKRKLNWEIYI
jgi:hypothetical protein